MKRKKDIGWFAYLELNSAGQSTEVEIATLRKEWIKICKAQWRKANRTQVKSLTVSFTAEEYQTITDAAKKHMRSRTRYCKDAVFSYLNRVYLIPDVLEVRHARQSIDMTYNIIQEAIHQNAIPSDTGRLALTKIFELERLLVATLYHPALLDDVILKTMQERPGYKDHLIKFIYTH